MQSPRPRKFAIVLASLAFVPGASAAAVPPSFTIAATNITMPGHGNAGSSPFTLTSVGGYAGQVRVECSYSGAVMGARVPTCGIFVNPVSTLASNKTATGSLTLVPYGKTIGYGAASLRQMRNFGLPACAAFILGIFLIGRGGRKRGRGCLMLAALSALCAGTMTACSSGMSGTFPYTVTATDIKTNIAVSSPFTVTVP
jgi:hypothetical protein